MKPLLISELEKEFNFTGRLVKSDEIYQSEFNKSFIYTINDNNNVTRLRINCFFSNNTTSLLGKHHEELQSLIYLDLKGNSIKDISPLKELIQLQYLDLSLNSIKYIEPLANLKNLKNLKLRNNDIEEISPLKDLKKLINLELGTNKIIDLSPLTELTDLQYLDLYYNRITNISPLENLTKMKILFLGVNTIRDISAIKNMQQLECLAFRTNYIQVLPEWITEFPKLDIQWSPDSKNGFITFCENPIKKPPVEIIKQGKTAIKQWFESQKT